MSGSDFDAFVKGVLDEYAMGNGASREGTNTTGYLSSSENSRENQKFGGQELAFSTENDDIQMAVENPYIEIEDGEEIEVLRSDLFAKFKNKSSYGCVGHTANYWYLCDYFGDSEYKIRAQIEIDGNEEFINKLEQKLKNRTFRDTEGFVRWVATVTTGKGQYNNGNVNVKVIRAKTDSNVSVVSGQLQEGDNTSTGTSNGQSTRDNELTGKTISSAEDWNRDVESFITPEGVVYGFVTPEGEIYLDETIINPSHPIHEYTHLWDRFLIKKKPELWAKGVSLMKQTPLWEKVLNSKQYGKKWISEGKEGEVLDNLIASEVHALLTGEKGKEILEDLAKKKGYKGIVAKLKAWIEEAWKTLKSTFSNWTEEEINNLKIDDFVNMAVRDFADGVNFKDITPQQNAARSALGAYYRWQKEHITKSEKFNEDHTYLLDGNPIADSVTQFWRKLFPEKIDGDHTYASSIGNSVDAIVRDYFKRNNPENAMYPNMTADRRDAIIEDCKRLERELKSRYGENAIIITEEFVLTGNVKAKGLAERVAGTMDMLVIDEAGDLHILDMKAKKGSIDSYNNRRNYTLQLNAYKELLEQCVPAFKGRVKSIDLIWFGHDYPTQGKGVTYTTDTNSGEITVTSGSYTGPMSEYSKWSTPSLSDNWDDALINLDIKPVFDEVTPVWETPKPKEEKSKDTPPSAGSHIDIHKDNPRLKLLKAFTHQQREYRVEMLAWDKFN